MWECIFSDIEKERKKQEERRKFIHDNQISLNFYKKKRLVDDGRF